MTGMGSEACSSRAAAEAEALRSAWPKDQLCILTNEQEEDRSGLAGMGRSASDMVEALEALLRDDSDDGLALRGRPDLTRAPESRAAAASCLAPPARFDLDDVVVVLFITRLFLRRRRSPSVDATSISGMGASWDVRARAPNLAGFLGGGGGGGEPCSMVSGRASAAFSAESTLLLLALSWVGSASVVASPKSWLSSSSASVSSPSSSSSSSSSPSGSVEMQESVPIQAMTEWGSISRWYICEAVRFLPCVAHKENLDDSPECRFAGRADCRLAAVMELLRLCEGWSSSSSPPPPR
ncbi:hypothetical protein BM221_003479 [Beauveria bassiana]|uniref:Uncharacterized protein n=1 Tax=Beauveria bassiana TaxID=176275 RepID=A0A2N6NUR4_BEABA|nr:hypothetical protein BM221_003479 [Beauveria bassiana]